jgi:hypothetical protein
VRPGERMDGANQGSTTKPASAQGGDKKRRWRSVQERRQIVEETLAPGASVARGRESTTRRYRPNGARSIRSIGGRGRGWSSSDSAPAPSLRHASLLLAPRGNGQSDHCFAAALLCASNARPPSSAVDRSRMSKACGAGIVRRARSTSERITSWESPHARTAMRSRQTSPSFPKSSEFI